MCFVLVVLYIQFAYKSRCCTREHQLNKTVQSRGPRCTLQVGGEWHEDASWLLEIRPKTHYQVIYADEERYRRAEEWALNDIL